MNDLIRREDVKTALVFSEKTGALKCDDLRNVLEVIDALPSAEPERKTGEWIKEEDKFGHHSFFCSRCGTQEGHDYPYCPNCGAEMKK